MNFNKYIRKNLVNIPGWRTKRKIVVIESDDWGSIRMPSREVYEYLLGNGVPVDKNYFTKYDCLESNDDIKALFEVLLNFEDKNGNHPCITANAVVANPSFEKIKSSNFMNYSYEIISETYKHYSKCNNVLGIWKKEGIKKNLLYPQFHGREHLNSRKWLAVLSDESNIFERLAFDKNALLGFGKSNDNSRKFNYMAPFEATTDIDMIEVENMTEDGLRIFKDIFGFASRSFVAGCSIRGDHIDKILKQNGVMCHQCGQQFVPNEDGTLKIINRFWGKENEYGQIYWRRNCTFEPSRDQNYNWIDSCINEMKIAFRWGKPAVINSHRVNYIGAIFPENRDLSLQKLYGLIKKITELWPDVEFMNSEQLGAEISSTMKKKW